MNTKDILIDIETYKLIESFRQSFEETPNDIIKRILNSFINENKIEIKEFRVVNENNDSLNNKGLYWKGCLLKNGLKLRSTYRGQLHTAEISKGKIIYNNQVFNSPSAAAVNATNGISINGWIFWEYYDNNTQSWNLLNSLRKP